LFSLPIPGHHDDTRRHLALACRFVGWTEGNRAVYQFRFLLIGEEDIDPVRHEVLREAAPDGARRPAVHLGGA